MSPSLTVVLSSGSRPASLAAIRASISMSSLICRSLILCPATSHTSACSARSERTILIAEEQGRPGTSAKYRDFGATHPRLASAKSAVLATFMMVSCVAAAVLDLTTRDIA